MTAAKNRGSNRMAKRQIDKGTLAGALLAVSGVVLGLRMDGGSVNQIVQPTAALIVVGGTVGAVLIQFPVATVKQAMQQMHQVLFTGNPMSSDYLNEITRWCMQARKGGMLSLDPHLSEIKDEFLKKSLTLAVDAVPLHELRETMELDLDLEEEREEGIVRVLEAAGGFAPTLGIIGAVLGLIQVMQRMDNVGEIGKGIAVAFVSTLYGIGLANLCFLPLAGKMKIRMRENQLMHEMTLEAVISISQGISARALRQKLTSYLVEGKVTRTRQAEPQLVTQ
jgi:chemotaxis protein MotA